MKLMLLDILACPACKGALKPTVTRREDEEIISGTLLCEKCQVYYAIQDSIPKLLSPEERWRASFCRFSQEIK